MTREQEREIIARVLGGERDAFAELVDAYKTMVYQLALRLFRENPKRRALFASYLAKLGDARALPELLRAADDPATGYIDFIELRSAIEQLGGEAPERDFDDDPDYQALNRTT